MNYADQYLRDNYFIFINKHVKNKLYMFYFYQYLCFKNIIGKIFKIKYKTQKFKNFTIHFDNFYAFFAIFTEIFIYNIYYFESDKSNPFIVDCGGNIGLSVLYFKYLYPEAIIECFEPDKETFMILEKNIKNNNLKDVNCHNKAVSGKSGELEFYSFGNMEGGPGNTLEKCQVNFSNVNSYKVKVVSLSELGYKYIDYLKMDIEGSEGNVFTNLSKSGLIKNIHRIVLEYHYDEGLENNKLSKIIETLENNNMHVIVNPNALVGFYTYESDFTRWSNKYVLMINAFHY